MLAISSPPSTAGEADHFSGIIDFGFDSFTEKYSVVEEDTVDNTVEFRTRLSLDYLRGTLFGDFLLLEAQANAGSNAMESTGRIKGAKSLHPARIAFEAWLTGKSFWKDTSYEYPNDYLRINGRLSLSRNIGEYTGIRISESIEQIDFDIRNEFDYDYFKSSTSLSFDHFNALSASLHGGLTAAYKSIPDSTEISYKSYSLNIDYRKEWSGRRSASITAVGERRSYAHEPVRSPYWSFFSLVSVKPLVSAPWGVSLEHTLEGYAYDTSTDIYFDYIENKTAILLRYIRGFRFDAGIGPMFAVLSSGDSRDDTYQEYGGKASVEYMDAGNLWISMTYELGRRSYDAYRDDPESAIFSDFFFNRFSLFTNWKVRDNAGINGFVSHEPRNYQRAGDDTSTTLFSLGVSYYF